MSIIIGSARIAEDGSIYGSKGDSTGREICTEPYYVHPYGWYAYKPKDPVKAELLAKEMLDLCNNDNVGYSQAAGKTGRLGVVYAITKYKHMKDIAIKTNADCSSSVRACIMAAGMGDPGNFTTYNEGKVLEATGQFEPRISVTDKTVLTKGMVLVTKRKGHTVIVVEDDQPEETTEEKSGGDPSKEPKWVGKVIRTSRLNVRSWAGIENPNIIKCPKLARNNMVDVCDTIKAKDGSDWHYIRIDCRPQNKGFVYGFVAARFIGKA